jgi:translocation protein SEC66
MFEIDWPGLLLPLAYVVVLGGSLMTFSTVYRKRKAGMSSTTSDPDKKLNFCTAQSATVAPWFGPNLQRNVYLSLLHLEPAEGSEKAPKVPDSVLRAALLRRAVEDICRVMQMRQAKAACSSLLQRGSVGDDLWQRVIRAEKELADEFQDVMSEVCIVNQEIGLTPFVYGIFS